MRYEGEPIRRFEAVDDRILNLIEFFKITPNRIETCEIYVTLLPTSTYTTATLLDTSTFSAINIHEKDLQAVREMISSDGKLAKGRRGIVIRNVARFSQEFKAERRKVKDRKK